MKRAGVGQRPEPEKQPANPAPALTPRQRMILDFVRSFSAANGYPPTVREIGEAVGLRSAASTHAQLASLVRGDWIRRDEKKPRTIVVREEAK